MQLMPLEQVPLLVQFLQGWAHIEVVAESLIAAARSGGASLAGAGGAEGGGAGRVVVLRLGQGIRRTLRDG